MNGHNTKLGRRTASRLAVGLALVLISASLGRAPRTACSQDGQAMEPEAGPYSYTFTYQGQLKDAGGLVNGPCDLRFGLWDDPGAGVPLGTLVVPNVTLVDGLFTARLDFGATAHTGGARWLEVAVRCPASSGSWVTLTPRQQLTGAPAALALALPFSAQGATGTALFSIANTGNGPALEVSAPLGAGLQILSAGTSGVSVSSADRDGVYVYNAGSPPATTPSDQSNGFEVAGAENHGLYVGNAGSAGVYVSDAGRFGLYVNSAGDDGVYVGSTPRKGVYVSSAGEDGVYIHSAGNPAASLPSDQSNGFEVAGAEGHGLYVGRSGGDGVSVGSAASDGLYVNSAVGYGVLVWSAGLDGLGVGSVDRDGVYVDWASDDGVQVHAAGDDGVNVTGNDYAGYFAGDIYVSGGCIGCTLATFGRNAGDRPLQPGDLVAIQGIDASPLDNAPRLWQVLPAGGGGAVVGVVRGRAELEVAREGEHLRDGQTGQRLVPRDGAAQPGDYLTIVIYGPMQVRTAVKAPGAIRAGTRLAVGDDGLARPLRTVLVEGVSLAESAPLIGIALAAPGADGLVWALVNPQ